MARNRLYPKATLKLLSEAEQQTAIRPVQLIIHTIVGSDEGAQKWMAREDIGIESHLTSGMDGKLAQLMPFDVRADCNWKANAWTTSKPMLMANGVVIPPGTTVGAISIEHEDDGTPEDTPFSQPQCDHLVDLMVWLADEWDIPTEKCKDPYAPGIGWHSMWGYNYKGQPVVNPWTTAYGKTCPGPARIAQIEPLIAKAATVPSRPMSTVIANMPILKAWDVHPQVRKLQAILHHTFSQDINISGAFDGATHTAVQRVQAVLRLPVTGVVDRDTWTALLEVAP